MTSRNLLIVGIVVAAAAALVWRVAVGKSRLVLRSDDIHFPTVSGFNLQRREFEFPRDFAGELNILFVPFLQQHQAIVNTWIPFAQELEATVPGVVYYELPTIDERPTLSRTFINEGMRAGIPDEKSRDRTITLYIDTDRFRAATNISGKDEVHTLLVNRAGDILWRETGRLNDAKQAALRTAVEANR